MKKFGKILAFGLAGASLFTGGFLLTGCNKKEVKYKITYELDGGSVVSNPSSYVAEQGATINEPTRNNYIFDGWHVTGNGINGELGNEVHLGSISGDVKLTAKWKSVFTFNIDGEITGVNSRVKNTIKRIVIPEVIDESSLDNINAVQIVALGSNAFNGCANLESVTISNKITSIKESSFRGLFSGCNKLREVKVESGNPKYDSRSNCNAIMETTTNKLIAGCKNTVIPDATTVIGKSAFCDIDTLTSISIPESVEIIESAAFQYCTNLTEINFAGTNHKLTTIGGSAFIECTNLRSVQLPNSVTVIMDWAFNHCDNLQSISLSQSLTTLGIGVFQFCEKLTTLTIPQNVISIGAALCSGSGVASVMFADSDNWIDEDGDDVSSDFGDLTLAASLLKGYKGFEKVVE